VYPAAGFGSMVAARKVSIAEFNIDENPSCCDTKYVNFMVLFNFIN
jgi:hypothetical protein